MCNELQNRGMMDWMSSQICHGVIIIIMLLFCVGLPTFVHWELERRSRIQYLSDRSIPVHGAIGIFHTCPMMFVYGCLVAWLLVLMDM